MSFLLNPHRFGSAPPSYSAEVTAWFAAMTTPPTGSTATALAAFLDGLVADGIYALADIILPGLIHDEQAGRVSAAAGNIIASKINSPVFTAFGGWNNNSGAGYLEFPFNPTSTSGRKLSQNDVALVMAALNNATSANFSVGTGARLRLNPRSTTTIAGRIASASNSSATLPAATSKGVSAGERVDSANVEYFKAGASLGVVSDTSATFENANLKVLTNTGSAFRTDDFTLLYLGQRLGATLQLALRNRYLDLCTAFGVTGE